MMPHADIFIVKALRVMAECFALYLLCRRRQKPVSVALVVALFASQFAGDFGDLVSGNYREANTADKPLAVAISVSFRIYLLAFAILSIKMMRRARQKFPLLEFILALAVVLPFLYRFTASLAAQWSSLSPAFLATELVVFGITIFAFTSAIITLAVTKDAAWNYLAAGVLVTCISAICRRYQASIGFPESSAFYHAVWTGGVLLQAVGCWHLRGPPSPIVLSQPSVIKTAKTLILLATYCSMMALLVLEQANPATIRLVTLLGAGGTALAVYLNWTFQRLQSDFLVMIEAHGAQSTISVIEADLPNEHREALHAMLRQRDATVRQQAVEQEKLASAHNLLAARAQLCARVSHDIRSPLAALDAAVRLIQGLSEDQRYLIRLATTRIRDIANDLLSQERKAASTGYACSPAAVPELVAAQIERALSEKRLELRGKCDIRLEAHTHPAALGLFARIDRVSFRRVLSNLLNNAVEAVTGGDTSAGEVVVTTTCGEDPVEQVIIIAVRDNGRGMCKETLARFGTAGFSSDKAEGNGIGGAHAKEAITSWGGTLAVDSSVGSGTTVSCILPICAARAWFKDEIIVGPADAVVIVDDDQAVHGIWRERLAIAGMTDSARVHHVHSIETLETHLTSRALDKQKVLFLVDYDFAGCSKSGLQVVTELGIGPRTVLVTSHHEDAQIRHACLKAGASLLPKELAGFVPISQAPEELDAVLLDDDVMFHRVWQITARDKGKRVATFKRSHDLLNASKSWRLDMPIYVDFELGAQGRGDNIIEALHNNGFHQVFLATGHSARNFTDRPWLRVVGKDFPF